jgi:uncharacterized membrane protein
MSSPQTRGAPAGLTRAVLPVYLLTAAGAFVWLAAIFLAPWLAGRSSGRAAAFVYAVFSPVCHQIPERCFQFHGHPLAVCGRCLGIYAGFAGGLVLYPLVRGFSTIKPPSARLFLLLTLPMAVDAGAGILGLWVSPIGVRLATGVLWGTTLPFFFVTGVADFLTARRKRLEGRALEKRPGKNIE